MQAKYSADEPFLIDAAAKLVELLASVGGTKAGAAAADSGCGPGNDLGPEQGEMPHAQAAVLYVLRVAVMEQLSETGQVGCCCCWSLPALQQHLEQNFSCNAQSKATV